MSWIFTSQYLHISDLHILILRIHMTSVHLRISDPHISNFHIVASCNQQIIASQIFVSSLNGETQQYLQQKGNITSSPNRSYWVFAMYTFDIFACKIRAISSFHRQPRKQPIMFEHNRLSIIAAQSNDEIQQQLEFKRQHHNVSLSHFFLQNCSNIAILFPAPEAINHFRMCVRLCVEGLCACSDVGV